MISNRSMPRSTVIPQIAYSDVAEAAEWLCHMFRFTVRLRIANHRIQINVGDAAVVLTERKPADAINTDGVMVRVEDIDSLYSHCQRHGVTMLSPPTDYPYGERQCTAVDFAGHYWHFSQSIADVNPTDWGGTPGQL